MRATGLTPSQLERLLAVGRSLVSTHEPERVLEQVLETARDLTGARFVAIGVLDPAKRALDRFLFVGIDEAIRTRIGPLPTGKGILGELIRNPVPLRLSRIGDHPHSYGFPAGHPPMETFLGVPVKIRDEVFGNLYLTEKADGADFDDADERLVLMLAEWAAIAIDNARAHAREQGRRNELERAARGLEATVALSRELGGETELPRVLELVVKRARALLDAGSSVVLLLEDDELVVADAAGDIPRTVIGNVVPLSSPVGDVMRAGRSQRIGGRATAALQGIGVKSSAGLLVPLHSRGADLGALVAFDPVGTAVGFSADDELALESFATAAATAIGATKAMEDERVALTIASSERERHRWARELHDETLQELGALNVLQEGALQSADPEAMKRIMARANEQVAGIITGLRGLITELRPAALDQLGIGPAIEALAESINSRADLSVDLDIDLAFEAGREPRRLAPDLEAAIYRIAQEALTNVVKHAEAQKARVRVEERGDLVTVTVEDDGKGVDPAADHEGFGLLGMNERVALASGTFDVGASPTGGTRVTATLPVARSS